MDMQGALQGQPQGMQPDPRGNALPNAGSPGGLAQPNDPMDSNIAIVTEALKKLASELAFEDTAQGLEIDQLALKLARVREKRKQKVQQAQSVMQGRMLMAGG